MEIGQVRLPLSELRIRARRLLKELRSSDVKAAGRAAKRFGQLRAFADKAQDQILASREVMRLKHALAIIALEQGYPSWIALKSAVEAAAPPSEEPLSFADGRMMYAGGLDVLLNRWFARYEDARASRQQMGGFLFPYDKQFFVCEAEGVRVLGLDPTEPDWQRIGWDWVEPLDRAAWDRLREKRLAAIAKSKPNRENGKNDDHR